MTETPQSMNKIYCQAAQELLIQYGRNGQFVISELRLTLHSLTDGYYTIEVGQHFPLEKIIKFNQGEIQGGTWDEVNSYLAKIEDIYPVTQATYSNKTGAYRNSFLERIVALLST